MVAIRIDRALWDTVRADLAGTVEQAGFLLADFDWATHAFTVRQWRAVPSDGFEDQSAYHISLTDETKVDFIRWAWDAGAALIEAHSHDGLVLPQFSPSDMWGLRDWVPHLFWRLRRRPYAALVLAGNEFDGVAWVSAPDQPEQVEGIEMDDGSVLKATGLTVARSLESVRPDHDEVRS